MTELQGEDVGSRLTIDTLAGAGIASSGAARGGGSLSRGIGDEISASLTSALEGVVEANPVSDLVGRGASQVEAILSTTRKGREENNNTVILGVGREVIRESGITEETLACAGTETNGVKVECGDGSGSESLLHLCLDVGLWSDAAEPIGVQCLGDILQLEGETCSGVVLI